MNIWHICSLWINKSRYMWKFWEMYMRKFQLFTKCVRRRIEKLGLTWIDLETHTHSTSAIYKLLLSRYWPNLNSSFCQSNICPGFRSQNFLYIQVMQDYVKIWPNYQELIRVTNTNTPLRIHIWLESTVKYIPISRMSPNHVETGGSPGLIFSKNTWILLRPFNER